MVNSFNLNTEIFYVFSLFDIIKQTLFKNLGGIMFKEQEYKVLYKRIIFTCFILVIYIFGSHISIVSSNSFHSGNDSFFKLAVSNVGGDLTNLNIFSLGLGPWLTSLILIMLLNYRNIDKITKQTRAEKHYKERILKLE